MDLVTNEKAYRSGSAVSRYIFWVMLGLGSILDGVMALFLTKIVGTTDPVVSFLFFFAVIFFLPAASALWGLVKGAIFYLWPARVLMEREYLRVLQSGRFPIRPAYDLDSYLNQTVDDQTESMATRLKAAHLAGQLSGLKTGKPIVVGMFNHLAAERALHKYLDQNAGPKREPMDFDPFVIRQRAPE